MSAISVLFTVIGSGVVAAGVTYLLASTKEHTFYMRKKAEELYLSADAFHKINSSYFLRALPLLREEISYNQYLDMAIEDGKAASSEDKNQNQVMNMITYIYFPRLGPGLAEWDQKRAAVNKILSDHKREYKTGNVDSERYLRLFLQASRAEDGCAQLFKLSIVNEGQILASPTSLWPRWLVASMFWLARFGLSVKGSFANYSNEITRRFIRFRSYIDRSLLADRPNEQGDLNSREATDPEGPPPSERRDRGR